MKVEPIIIEEKLNAPVERVWRALISANEMRQWYFPIKEFKAEPGFEFQFSAGPEGGKQYLHLCKVTEAEVLKKLSYSWKYDGFTGHSLVTFELFPQGDDTLLRLTHEGVDTFPVDEDSNLTKKSFVEGWNQIIGVSLKKYVERKFIAETEVRIHAPAQKVWQALTDPGMISKYMFGARVDSEWKPGSNITFKGEWEGKQYEDKGKILRMEPNRFLQYTHYSPLSGLPDAPENYHTVTIELNNGGGITRLHLWQDNNASEQEREHSKKNWESMMQGLKKLVE